MSGLCRVRIPGWANGERCALHRNHGGEFHQTRKGQKFPLRNQGEREVYGL